MFDWLLPKKKRGSSEAAGDSPAKPPVISAQAVPVPPVIPIIPNAPPPILPSPNPKFSPQVSATKPIIVHDEHGRRYELSRAAYAEKVLAMEFREAANDPHRLYGAIVMALQDEFLHEALDPAQRLFEIDPNHNRAATMLGITFMKNGMLDEAERILSGQLAREKNGPLMVNLAKVWDALGRTTEARQLLREALSIDPNLDNGLMWHGAIAREEGGQEGYLRALRDVARETGSWRPQLWLARDFLEHGDKDGAVLIYRQVLDGREFPGDALMMITGDMGNYGLAKEMIQLVLPRYDELRHDILAGRNLLQACVELGLRAEGLDLCNRLDRLERYDHKAWIDEQRVALGGKTSPQTNTPSSGPGDNMFRWVQDPSVKPPPDSHSAPAGPPPIPQEIKTGSTPAPVEYSAEFKSELRQQLERVAKTGAEEDMLTAGIGMIKAGARQALPGWLKLFGQSDVFVVSAQQRNPQTAFVFGPKGDHSYVAVFTQLHLAQECLREFPMLKFAMKLSGVDLLHLAKNAQKGIWINPLNSACNVQFPAEAMDRFIQEATGGPPAL
jgi:tetratricopeptide (TPR) repeat protein